MELEHLGYMSCEVLPLSRISIMSMDTFPSSVSPLVWVAYYLMQKAS